MCDGLFTAFVIQDGEVWKSLASVLVLLVSNAVVSSPLVEGLWLCRWHHFKNQEATMVEFRRQIDCDIIFFLDSASCFHFSQALALFIISRHSYSLCTIVDINKN